MQALEEVTASLSDAQLDGLACIQCGCQTEPMVPVGTGPRGQLFVCLGWCDGEEVSAAAGQALGRMWDVYVGSRRIVTQGRDKELVDALWVWWHVLCSNAGKYVEASNWLQFEMDGLVAVERDPAATWVGRRL